MAILACPECGTGVEGTPEGKIRRHNRTSRKFDTCPASGLTAAEYSGMHPAVITDTVSASAAAIARVEEVMRLR